MFDGKTISHLNLMSQNIKRKKLNTIEDYSSKRRYEKII